MVRHGSHHDPAGPARRRAQHRQARCRDLASHLCRYVVYLVFGRALGAAPGDRVAQRHPARAARRAGCGRRRGGSARLRQLRAEPRRPPLRRGGVHPLRCPRLAEPRDWAASLDCAVSASRRGRALLRDRLGIARQPVALLLRTARRSKPLPTAGAICPAFSPQPPAKTASPTLRRRISLAGHPARH